MAEGIFWNGAEHFEPGVKSRIDKSGLRSLSVSGNATLVLIGDSDSLEPMKFTKISNSLDARNQLRGGALLQAYLFASAPSPSLPGATDIAVINVRNLKATEGYINLNPYSTAAGTTFANGQTPAWAAGQGNVIHVKSKVYGSPGTKLKFAWDEAPGDLFDHPRRYIKVDKGDGYADPIDIRKLAATITNTSNAKFTVKTTISSITFTLVPTGSHAKIKEQLDKLVPPGKIVFDLTKHDTLNELVEEMNETFKSNEAAWNVLNGNNALGRLQADVHYTMNGDTKLDELLDVNQINSFSLSKPASINSLNFATVGELTSDTANMVAMINSRFGDFFEASRFTGELPQDNTAGDYDAWTPNISTPPAAAVWLRNRAVQPVIRMTAPKANPNPNTPNDYSLKGYDASLSTRPNTTRFNLAIDLLEAEYVDTVVAVTDLLDRPASEAPYTNDEQDSIHQYGKSHVLKMSVTKRGKRRRYVAAAGDNKTDPVDFDTITAGYNCNRVLYCGYGMMDYHYAGKGKIAFSPVYTAVKVASMICGSSPQVSLTSQSISGLAPANEVVLNEAGREACIKASVVVPFLDEGRNYLLRCTSTHRTDANYFDVEPSVLRCSDFTQNDLEKKLNQSRISWAGAGKAPSAGDIKRVVTETLGAHAAQGWISPSDLGPAFGNINARVDGDAFYWDVDLRFPIPKNFGFGSHHLVK